MKATEKKNAKLCYEHIGGKQGNLLLEQFVDKGWLAKEHLTDKNFYITEKGIKEFTKLRIDLSLIHS